MDFVSYEQDISELRLRAHISADSCDRDLWDFEVLDATVDSNPKFQQTMSIELAYIQQMKRFWQPDCGLEVPEEWAHLILPPEEPSKYPWRNPNLHLWLPISFISTLISPLSSQLRLVPATDFLGRSAAPDYVGPHFPVVNCSTVDDPPAESDSHFIQQMVNLLLCQDHDIFALYRLGSVLDGIDGCQLKLNPEMRFPPHFGASPEVDFAVIPEWKHTDERMLRRAVKTPLRFSSPALLIGVQLEENTADKSYASLSSEELIQLARVAQPHLEALLIARQRVKDSDVEGTLTDPHIPPNCVFVLARREETVFIVAHIAYSHQSSYRYQSLLVDELPFPSYEPGRDEGFLARLRVLVALLTFRRHASRLSALWDSVVWPPAVFDAESAL
ncbi:hypothetical protein C8R46DRAFT_596272 [Mycena filopes]|nr:hypothetical protein C8R46DRAFT_596272 [Mycena filopes]